MCDITLALTLGATVIGAVGSIQQGMAAQQAANYNAKISEMNAKLADRRAKDALERGKIAEQQRRQQLAQIKGKQVAAMAANGVDLTFGSPLDTMIDDATIAELDALTVRRNAATEAYDYDVQGVNYRSQAQLQRMGGQAAMTGAVFNAAGTVLGGASQGYRDYWSQRYGTVGSIA